MTETDAEFLDRIERAVETTGDNWIRLLALARRGAAVQATPAFTEGHCEHKKAPGGCQLHNLHCGYPDCDRRPPPPAGEMSDLVERLRARKEPSIENDMHYPQIVDSDTPDAECFEAADRIAQLEAALRAWNSAVRVDVLMEGPRYMGVSGEAGRQAWELTRAALAAQKERT